MGLGLKLVSIVKMHEYYMAGLSCRNRKCLDRDCGDGRREQVEVGFWQAPAIRCGVGIGID
jgi:hypothetical protein